MRPRRTWRCVVLVLSISSLAFAQGRPRFVPDEEAPMTAGDIAKTLGVQREFDWLERNGATTADSLKALRVRQKIIETVSAASLEVDETAGQTDAEIAETSELQNYLEGRRQKEIDMLNLASLIAGGSLGTASASLGLVGNGKASSITGILAGGTTAGLSAIGLKRRGSHKQALQVPSNMLANVFQKQPVENDVYPPVVKAFMQSVAPNEKNGLNRQQRLIANWVEVGRIPDPDSPKGRDKVHRLTTMPSEQIALSISDLSDRQAMLYDFRAKVLYLKRDLARLLSALPKDSPLD
jgi:hypothetical protein